MPKPVIDYKKCKACGSCAEICPFDVFKKEGSKVVVKNPASCVGCKACEAQCTPGAIKVEE